jgi:hypothetical protein
MKKTDEDRRFARMFAEALLPRVTAERNEGKSLAEIAARLGVTAAGLQKQLAGGTPSVRTVALAHLHYKIAIPYAGVDVSKALKRRATGGQKEGDRSQLLLPFEITAPGTAGRIEFEIVPTRRAPIPTSGHDEDDRIRQGPIRTSGIHSYASASMGSFWAALNAE